MIKSDKRFILINGNPYQELYNSLGIIEIKDSIPGVISNILYKPPAGMPIAGRWGEMDEYYIIYEKGEIYIKRKNY